jgi:hypothetical protein
VVYLNPGNPDPNPPERIVQDRWTSVSLSQRLPFTVSNVVKIANASDPRSSSFAVYHDHSDVFIWGLVDQGNSYHDFVTYNADSGPERPGLFQASIVGVGHIVAYRRYELIGDLHVNQLRVRAIDALARGPLHEVLSPAIRRYRDSVRNAVGIDVYQRRSHWDDSLTVDWLASLRRLLLRIQQYGHGGAILIAPDGDPPELEIKYRLRYERLRTNLQGSAIASVTHTHVSDQIYELFIDQDSDTITTQLYLDESVSANDSEEARTELDGVLWFISLLTRVDGVVLLTSDLEVRGFGAEILTDQAPTLVMKAGDEQATTSRLAPLDYFHLGTRHRSMMRYCAKFPGSVGLVVSQDGDVRAMTQIEGTLVCWENLQLRFDDFERKRVRRR